MKRFVTAVMRHETNTFSPVPTPLESFGRVGATGRPSQGQVAIDYYRGTNNPVAAFIDLIEAEGAELIVPIAANSHPSAACPATAFDTIATTITDTIKLGCDGVMLDLHGAMVTEAHFDGEGELLRRIRAVAPDVPIAIALDFHSNLSADIIDNADVITGYRTYPHIDMYETGQRAGRTLLRQMKGEVKPVMSWHSLPILSHMNVHSPSRPPMKDLMDRAIAAEACGDVLNASLFGGFPLADIPQVGLSAIIVADGDKYRGDHLLYELMSEAWDRRAEFEFEIEPMAQSIARAKAMTSGPIILVDHGDNTGAGGNQDTMAVIKEALEQGLEDVVAGPICDPKAVAESIAAGVGSDIRIALGGKWDVPSIKMKGEPLVVNGRVTRITDGEFTVTGPMMTGTQLSLGRTVVIDTGPMQIVVSEKPYEPFDTGCFTHCGIDPTTKRYIILKSRQHFRAGFGSLAKEIVMVAGPGPCASDYSQFPWCNVRRPIYPLDRDCPSNLPTQGA